MKKVFLLIVYPRYDFEATFEERFLLFQKSFFPNSLLLFPNLLLIKTEISAEDIRIKFFDQLSESEDADLIITEIDKRFESTIKNKEMLRQIDYLIREE